MHAYVIDTGILITHNDFGGRASHGRDTVSEDNDSTDCHGHGTHVAGTVGGQQYGVAKAVQIVGVRVLNCAGSGTTTDRSSRASTGSPRTRSSRPWRT